MRYSTLTASVSSTLLLIALSTSVGANNPNQMRQAQQAKQQQALQRKQNLRTLKQRFADLPQAERKAQIKKVVLPKLRARIANDQNKIKSKDKAIKAENKKLAGAVKQRLRAQQQLESLDRQAQDLEAATARGAAGNGTVNQQVKLNNQTLAARKALTEATESIKRHQADIEKLNNQRKTHNERLVKHLKQKRDGKALISNKAVMPRYARARAAQAEDRAAGSGDNGHYQSFAETRRRAQRQYGQALSPVGSHYMSVDAIAGLPAARAPSNYGRLVLRPAAATDAEAPEADQERALPTAAGQRVREPTQSSDANGNYVLLPSAPAAALAE